MKTSSKFFEGVFLATIVTQIFKKKNESGEWIRTDEPNPYDRKTVWEIELKIGEGHPKRISLYGGEPFEGKQHKWATFMKACGLDPKTAYPDYVIGKQVKVLMYAEKPTTDGNVWSSPWNVAFSPDTEDELIQKFFMNMLERAGEKNWVKNKINPASKYVEPAQNGTTGAEQTLEVSVPTDKTPDPW